MLDFQDSEIKKLRECFNSLDDDGSGSIGIEELEDPLIGLGFCETRDEVKEIVMDVDEDQSGQIEFPEFLSIINNSDSNEKRQKIFEFFKKMTQGSFNDEEEEEGESPSSPPPEIEEPKPTPLKKRASTKSSKAQPQVSKQQVDAESGELSFNLLVQKIRRKHMIAALLQPKSEAGERGL